LKFIAEEAVEMMWYYGGGGWGWLWMGSFMVLFLGTIIVLTMYAIRAFTSSKQTTDLAMETLRRRLASGEIDKEEFAKTKRALG
jgi:uncharacterized membrane protein